MKDWQNRTYYNHFLLIIIKVKLHEMLQMHDYQNTEVGINQPFLSNTLTTSYAGLLLHKLEVISVLILQMIFCFGYF